MRLSLNWLSEFVDYGLSPEELADRLTLAGLEVEGIARIGEGIEGVVVGAVRETRPHPGADKLTLCRVETPGETVEVVCGASNVRPGIKIPLARVGARLPDGTVIRKGKFRGEVSQGMICSEKELGLAESSEGIWILPDDLAAGTELTPLLRDVILTIGVTPNRGDCLSVLGIAREVAALTGAPLRERPADLVEGGESITQQVAVEIADVEGCPRYAARVVRGVRVGPAPFRMQRRLEAAGLRAINNVVDVTNYVLLERGQPLHAFDLPLLADQRIVVRRGRAGERIITLDGVEREVTPETLLICDGRKPVALAGVMGGRETEVTERTADLLLESAYFLPVSVRRTAKRLGLQTEASYRFERGTDPEGVLPALDRAAGLLAGVAGGQVARGVVDCYPRPMTPPTISLRCARLNLVLGTAWTEDAIRETLTRLGIRFTAATGERLVAVPPMYRSDLTREIDLIEEVARVRGYDRIPVTQPVGAVPPPLEEARSTAFLQGLRGVLVSLGYTEAIHFSFGDARDLDLLGLPTDDPRRQMVKLRNPLAEDQAYLRSSLLPGLMGALQRNLHRGAADVRLFEIGRVFLARGEGLPQEGLHLAAVAAGAGTGSWRENPREVVVFDLKGAVEGLLAALRVSRAVWIPEGDVPYLHPTRAARLEIDGKPVGRVGEIHPEVAARYDLKLRACLLELSLEALPAFSPGAVRFRPLPRFPAVQRDLALVVEDALPAGRALEAIRAVASDLLEEVRLFDLYRGQSIPKGKKSLAFRLTYRAPDRTLTDQDVEAMHHAILDRLVRDLGGEIRRSSPGEHSQESVGAVS
jgi:phenylalanyl-tRNA synthetase beta chain